MIIHQELESLGLRSVSFLKKLKASRLSFDLIDLHVRKLIYIEQLADECLARARISFSANKVSIATLSQKDVWAVLIGAWFAMSFLCQYDDGERERLINIETEWNFNQLLELSIPHDDYSSITTAIYHFFDLRDAKILMDGMVNKEGLTEYEAAIRALAYRVAVMILHEGYDDQEGVEDSRMSLANSLEEFYLKARDNYFQGE